MRLGVVISFVFVDSVMVHVPVTYKMVGVTMDVEESDHLF